MHIGFVYTVHNYIYRESEQTAEGVFFRGAFTDLQSAKEFITHQLDVIGEHLGPVDIGYGTLPYDETSAMPIHRGAYTGDIVWTAHVATRNRVNPYGMRISQSKSIFAVRRTPLQGSALNALAEAAE